MDCLSSLMRSQNGCKFDLKPCFWLSQFICEVNEVICYLIINLNELFVYVKFMYNKQEFEETTTVTAITEKLNSKDKNSKKNVCVLLAYAFKLFLSTYFLIISINNHK